MTTDNGHGRTVTVIKIVHTLIWLVVEACVIFLLHSGVRRRSDRLVAAAGAVVAGESVVFLANGARCPLTSWAERLGTGSGSVTDIFLPRWPARNLPVIHVPLVLTAGVLHGRNVLRARPPDWLRVEGRIEPDLLAP